MIKSNQRNDIQCLRALAVIAVILFHLWPNIFFNGFLGVDIFFVISGYLMALSLSKMNDKNFTIKMFYFQRIKRIFPLCLFVLCLTLFAGKIILLSNYYNNLLAESLWAICFGTNMRTLFHKENYFEMVAEYNFLLHTWSLGIEIQYYFIVPIIFKIGQYLKRIPTTIILLGIISFLFQTYFNINNQQSVAFNLILCRIWQFSFGAVAFFFSVEHGEIISEKSYIPKFGAVKNVSFQLIFALLIIIFLFMPISIKTIITKILLNLTITILAFLIISLPQPYYYPTFLNGYLSNIFVYIGNASYSAYLIHWPIIVFAKYINFTKTNTELCVILIFIIIISIVVHELFEKPLRHASNNKNVLVIFLLYTSFVLLYMNDQMDSISSPPNIMTLDDKISKNIAMTYEANDTLCKKDEIIETFYKLKDETLHQWRCSVILASSNNGTIKKEAVVLGNSYAAAQFSGIYQALKLLGYTKAYLIARSGCLPHGRELNKEYSDSNYACNEWIKNSFDEFLIAVKPEMLIISARYSMFKHLMDPLPSSDLYAKDFAIQELRNGILRLSNFSRMLLFVSPNADFDFSHIKVDETRLSHLKSMINFTYNSASTIARNLQLNLSLEEFVLSKEYVYEITHASEVRLTEAIKDCSNCLFFNTTEFFCDNNGCPLYDKKTQLAILRDQSHLSTTGVEMLTKPLFNFMSLKIT